MQERKGVSARLLSLFPASDDNCARVSDSVHDNNMGLRHAAMPRPHVSAPSSPSPRLHLLDNRSTMSEHSPQPKLPQAFPFLQWFNSRPASPSAALSEALHDGLKLPARPDPARLPPSLNRSQSHRRAPSVFSNLTRSTLPTSSLSSPGQSTESSNTHYTVDSEYPVVLNHSPPSVPTRSSLDTLRSLQAPTTLRRTRPSSSRHQQKRSIHLPSPIRSWFQSEPPDDKQHESILVEEDQAETADQERERIRHKCPFLLFVFWRMLMSRSRSIAEQPNSVLSWTSWV